MAFRILDRDIGGGHLHLTGSPDGDDALLTGEAVGKGVDDLKISFADKFRFDSNRNPIGTDCQAVPGITGGTAFQDDGLAAAAGKELRCSAAGVGLLDCPGQRAFCPDGETSGVRRRRTGEKTGGDDELVVRPQGVAGWRNLCGDDGGRQTTTAITCPGCGEYLQQWW